ncbi:MAG TPA: peptide deformylase [Actinomycetota bacterium]|nr:peptide deformylase [Actinomycetota bacterium]
MPVREVRIYPDPVLKSVAAPIGRIDDDALALANDLIDTMRAHERCVGIAANQVGALRRCVVVDVTGHPRADSCHGLIVLFDPIVSSEEGSEVAREGCLSVPDLTANVRRATKIAVTGLDPDGRPRAVSANAFEARALLHEIDHLDGVLFLDRVANLETDVFRRKRGSGSAAPPIS